MLWARNRWHYICPIFIFARDGHQGVLGLSCAKHPVWEPGLENVAVAFCTSLSRFGDGRKAWIMAQRTQDYRESAINAWSSWNQLHTYMRSINGIRIAFAVTQGQLATLSLARSVEAKSRWRRRTATCRVTNGV